MFKTPLTIKEQYSSVITNVIVDKIQSTIDSHSHLKDVNATMYKFNKTFEELDTAIHTYNIIQKYGISKPLLNLLDENNCLKVNLESLSTIPSINTPVYTIALEGVWDSIKAFFRKIWDFFKSIGRKIKGLFTSSKTSTEANVVATEQNIRALLKSYEDLKNFDKDLSMSDTEKQELYNLCQIFLDTQIIIEKFVEKVKAHPLTDEDVKTKRDTWVSSIESYINNPESLFLSKMTSHHIFDLYKKGTESLTIILNKYNELSKNLQIDNIPTYAQEIDIEFQRYLKELQNYDSSLNVPEITSDLMKTITTSWFKPMAIKLISLNAIHNSANFEVIKGWSKEYDTLTQNFLKAIDSADNVFNDSKLQEFEKTFESETDAAKKSSVSKLVELLKKIQKFYLSISIGLYEFIKLLNKYLLVYKKTVQLINNGIVKIILSNTNTSTAVTTASP
jgi:hypothetical protein